jgi:competence protein ComEA
MDGAQASPAPDPGAGPPGPGGETRTGELLAALRAGAWPDPLRSTAVPARRPLLVLGVLALVAAGVWYLIGRSDGGPPGPAGRPTEAPAAGAGATERTRPARLVRVHVAGAVTRPGVVAVPAGARVVDALAAAGGPRPDADLDRLNLAAVVGDGQRVAVPVLGAPPPPLVDGGGADAGGVADPSAVPGGPPPKLDLNAATTADLEALPGIGPVLAQAILDHRRRLGRFRSVEDLLGVRGIGERRFADLRDRVTV